MRGLLDFAKKAVIVGIVAAAVLTTVGLVLIDKFRANIDSLYTTVAGARASEELRQKLEKDSRLIEEGYGHYGSGCEPVEGIVFTTRHLAGNVILDRLIGINVPIKFQNKEMRVHSFGSTVQDYAVLTTTPPTTQLPFDKINYSKIPPFEGQILHTFGHPYQLPELYQKLEVMKVSLDEKTKTTILSFKTDYVAGGISGACVADEHGNFVGIIKTSKHLKDPRTMDLGEISVIKPLK